MTEPNLCFETNIHYDSILTENITIRCYVERESFTSRDRQQLLLFIYSLLTHNLQRLIVTNDKLTRYLQYHVIKIRLGNFDKN